MALVKMYRDIPEVTGGNTEAMIPEEAVNEAVANGWKKAEVKADSKKDEVKTEPPKPEAAKEAKVDKAGPKVTDVKSESKKGQKTLRDE